MFNLTDMQQFITSFSLRAIFSAALNPGINEIRG
jgi:hypothetical protein